VHILASASASQRLPSASLPNKFQDFPGPRTQISRTFQVVEILQTQFLEAWEPCELN